MHNSLAEKIDIPIMSTVQNNDMKRVEQSQTICKFH